MIALIPITFPPGKVMSVQTAHENPELKRRSKSSDFTIPIPHLIFGEKTRNQLHPRGGQGTLKIRWY